MLESIKEIGEALLAEKVEVQRLKGEGTLLVKVIFDVDNRSLDIDLLECRYKGEGGYLDHENVLAEYLWVGNDIGAKPQRRLTTDKVEYLLDPGEKEKKKWAINEIIEEIEAMKCVDSDLLELRDMLSEIVGLFFQTGQSLVPVLEEVLGKKGVKRCSIALYTVSLRKNGIVIDLVKEPGYRKFIRHILYEPESEKWPIVHGRCHVCGKTGKVLSNPAYPEGSMLCMYNVDKLGFMPRLSSDPEMAARAHAVCPECKEKLRLGLNFIERHLRVQIGEAGKQKTGKLNAFLIPKVSGLTREHLEKLARTAKDAFGIVKACKSLEEVERLVSDVSDMFREQGRSMSAYSINILFGRRESSHFAFRYLIQDVPVTRLIEIAGKAAEISNEAKEFIMGNWEIGLDNIYGIFPLRVSQRDVDWKPFVELLNAMLSGTLFPWENIVARALLFARICRYGAEAGYTVKAPRKDADLFMCDGIFKYNLLFRLLREIGVVEIVPDTTSCFVPDAKLEKFLSKQGYTEPQRSLFLLGFLVGQIGVAQYNKGDGRKSILNKVNFEGMSAERVKHLANCVLEGLRNYRLLNSYNEAIYACMKAMLDRNIGNMHNPLDNTFYLLSGYAYATLQKISGGEKEDE
jgi:CRISPR-associated protein Csh1